MLLLYKNDKSEQPVGQLVLANFYLAKETENLNHENKKLLFFKFITLSQDINNENNFI